MTVKLVVRGADYVLAPQQNQEELHRQVGAHFVPLLPQPPAHQQRAKNHGRGKLRHVWVSQQWELVEAGANWPGLQTLGSQQTAQWVAGKMQQPRAIFLSSLTGASATTLAVCTWVLRH